MVGFCSAHERVRHTPTLVFQGLHNLRMRKNKGSEKSRLLFKKKSDVDRLSIV